MILFAIGFLMGLTVIPAFFCAFVIYADLTAERKA